MSPKQVARIIVTFLLIASVIWLGRNQQSYSEAVVSIFFACTLISVSVIHLRILPSGRDALLVLCGEPGICAESRGHDEAHPRLAQRAS